VLQVWAAYTATTGYVLYCCTFRKMSRTLPKQVYRWFLGVFRVSVMVGATGYVLLTISIFGAGVTQGPSPLGPLTDPATVLTVLWYGLYFGILTRDCAEVASDRMAAALVSGGGCRVERVLV
jgi:RING finger protein 121/175